MKMWKMLVAGQSKRLITCGNFVAYGIADCGMMFEVCRRKLS
jgi:hypothetical protein